MRTPFKHLPLSPKSDAKCGADRCCRHTLTNDEKLEYINAELCLMSKPATLGLPGAVTRFDELQAIHQLQAYKTHYVVRRSLEEYNH